MSSNAIPTQNILIEFRVPFQISHLRDQVFLLDAAHRVQRGHFDFVPAFGICLIERIRPAVSHFEFHSIALHSLVPGSIGPGQTHDFVANIAKA